MLFTAKMETFAVRKLRIVRQDDAVAISCEFQGSLDRTDRSTFVCCPSRVAGKCVIAPHIVDVDLSSCDRSGNTEDQEKNRNERFLNHFRHWKTFGCTGKWTESDLSFMFRLFFLKNPVFFKSCVGRGANGSLSAHAATRSIGGSPPVH